MTPEELEAAVDADPFLKRWATATTPEELEIAVDADPEVGMAAVRVAKITESTPTGDPTRAEVWLAYLAARKAAAERLQPRPVTLREMANEVLRIAACGGPVTGHALALEAIAYLDKTEKELGELRQEKADQAQANDRWAMHRLKSDELLALKKLVVAWADALDAEDAVFFRAGSTPDLYDAAQRFKKEGVGS